MRDTILDIIWDELVQAKSWEQYLSDYATYKLNWIKWFNLTTILLSVFGATINPLLTEENTWITTLTFILAIILQILSNIQKEVVIDMYTLNKMILLRTKYNDYLKLIASQCWINKPITSHTARHTFIN